MLGLKATKNLPTASSLCGACGEVCPVKIPIPKLLLRLRKESVSKDLSKLVMKGQGSGRNSVEALVWKIWAVMHKYEAIYRISMWCATRLRWAIPKKIGVWTSVRSAPKLAPKTLHELIKTRQCQTGKITK